MEFSKAELELLLKAIKYSVKSSKDELEYACFNLLIAKLEFLLESVV